MYPRVRVVVIVEPFAVGSIILNLIVQKCANAADVYIVSFRGKQHDRLTDTAFKICIKYALSKLSAVGVYLYIDAAHAGTST